MLRIGPAHIIPNRCRKASSNSPDEFVEVVNALGDSWADDAIIGDAGIGRSLDCSRVRRIDWKGRFYSVAGPLNAPRTPQDRPVLVQAGSSATGKAFAARHAEAVFTAHLTKASEADFYAELKDAATAEGRHANELVISAEPRRRDWFDRRRRTGLA
ncbi:LLM class flavin-dependent oxidoreductase [Paraburkholderia sp. MMS20-SJTN17]|uniref:LLM class flavin-dependent oxidoreductase n=1 Tax=Paraburkholderia translucens TaxID=2886945 RepID=A0ABS8KC71_9BURK|nr:LLM class flavin-dependent oxidoreductase [Paraburkholderia sp. MMS20-SJTN17]MCC8402364.1 LLM class flavin-dependent oxidoreductase [Paraburkholderia sp. MMS20-SJTN17]